jgi:acetolactate synthase-1/2/3 large subunit
VCNVVEEVVGWGSKAAWALPEARSIGRVLCEALVELGVTHGFGVLGGGIAAFAAGMDRSPLRFFHTRHEAGAAFAAIEAHFATGRPALVVTTTGPGFFNALNGAMAARADGAKLLVISGATSRALLGRGAVQETGATTILTQSSPLFHYASQPETVDELRGAIAALANGWAQPGGFVAHLALPMSLQTTVLADNVSLAPPRWTRARTSIDEATLDDVLARLRQPSLMLLGHGARGASAEAAAFARAAQLPVLSSPRAKGTFPEDDPLYVGVTGAAAHAEVTRYLGEHPPSTMLVVGSRLGEVTTFLAPIYVPRDGWIHVDVDPSAFGAAFPDVDVFGVVAEAKALLAALHARALATGWFAHRSPQPMPRPRMTEVLAARDSDVRPAYLMEVVQRLVVEPDAATVMAEAGTSFIWCNHALRFTQPNRYRTSAAWGSMGHFTTGGIGAALASEKRVVAIVGDGAMLMNNELNTAAQYAADVVWIVLNDAQLALNQHSMAALGMRPIETQMPRTDFAAFARSQGANGISVKNELELADAIERALAMRGPVVVDVATDRNAVPPVLRS